MCDRIVSAHTVQRSRVLERLVDSTNHVGTFYRSKSSGAPHSVGWKDASTFTGFCGRHDSTTFAPVETKEFDGGPEQSFLLAYRALCYEVNQKKGLIRSSPIVRGLADPGLPETVQRGLQHVESLIEAGARKGLEAMRMLKAEMDAQLVQQNYRGWSRLVATFRGDLCVASTGGTAPNRDLERRKLQVLHDPDPNNQQTMLCSVVADQNSGAVVLTWPTTHTAPRIFVESILAKGRARLPSLLVQFMFAYLENTYFSSQWWQVLPETDRAHLAGLAAMWNAYYTEFEYSYSALVPWEILDAKLDDAA